MLIQLRLNHVFSEEERELAEVILKFEVCGFPLSMYRVHLLAFQYAHINSIKGFSTTKKNAGYKWAKGYLARNPDIVVKKCSSLSVAHAMAANPTNIQQWFAKYLAVLEQFNIQSPEQIWSGDETGVQNVPAVSKVLGHHNTTAHRQVSGECCDMGQNDTIGRIELNPSFVLSSDNTNYKNDIQLFPQLFDELRVNGDYQITINTYRC